MAWKERNILGGSIVRIGGWLKWLTLCVAGLAVAPAAALDPAKTIAQYKHSRWLVEDGAPESISSFAQGADGYLWIGARDGLFRFDGIRFEHVATSLPGRSPSMVTALLAARDGSIWAGFETGGIARYSRGALVDTRVPNAQGYVMSLVQTADGAIWAQMGGGLPSRVRFAKGGWEALGESWNLPNEGNVDALAARDGSLWMTTIRSVFFLKPGSRRFQRLSVDLGGHAALSEDASGHIWLSDSRGSRAIAGGTTAGVAYPTPPFPRGARTFFDRDNVLWGATRSGSGIFRVRSPRPGGEPTLAQAAAKTETFGRFDGLTSQNTRNIFEDREGNIWIAHTGGLDRFRSASIINEPLLTQVPRWGEVLLGASDGSVYVGEAPGVYRILPGGHPHLVLSGAGESEAMCEGPDGAVWMIQAQRVVRFMEGRRTNLPRPASHQAIIDCAVDSNNVLWLTAAEGLYRRIGAGWSLHPMPENEDSSGNMPIIAKRDGSLLVYATARSLRRISFPRSTDLLLARAGALNGLRTIYEGPNAVLAGGSFGLARLDGDQARFLSSKQISILANVSGIVQTPAGETWLMTGRGIVRISTAALSYAFDKSRFPPHYEVFDYRDGIPAFNSRDGKRDAVRGGDGRIWFATTAGTVWIDPARLRRNNLPPPLAITALKAGGAIYRDPARLSLPAGTSTAEINYAALSLAVPERVEVRYRLEGADTDWIDPGMRRQAFYTNLGPGTYRFRVIAANNDGVWNRKGATLEFTIAPTFFQSNWFLLLCLIGVAMLAWLAYSIRVRQVTSRIRAGLEVRLAERERIARELHDTLLQTFQGLVLRFQAVAERIPADQPLRSVIDHTLDRADDALAEGRKRVLELRTVSGDLAEALVRSAEEYGGHGSIRFNLTIEGHPRALQPVARDEIEQVAAEAIRNAFLHARAREIEAALSYRANELRFDLRDDGIGLPANVMERGGREGHFGLVGMRERARRLGGMLTISSREKGGTEVALSVPARSAYADTRQRRRLASIFSAGGGGY
ncbi:signal transduction histidine kinase [Sphingomonas leidyi]|uniref:Signal transduction histidine kinase n=1 Tax=Sphingomonas leidyi TaxID=68569 RepID=A0A7X5UXY1_9SPHN|nr:sensor histidine kinase [Sphingomonas leidyi]NIJ64221.1 signal transduction histidine kinase [Sphingomonas leidyi]